MMTGLADTKIIRIETLVKRVKEGDIKLPKFQRPFVWKRDDILNLCDSVYRGYPIGSILLWLTRQKLASERRIGDLEISERTDAYPVNYLLDGQQRLSSLCGALHWNGKDLNSQWRICFDLDKEVFFYPKHEDLEVHHFPMNKLLSTLDYVNQCKLFSDHPERDRFEQNATKLLSTIKDYEVATITISDMEMSEVAPIFERINSKGRQLTMVDLTRAATWCEGFDLNETLENVKQVLRSKNFDDVADTEILKNVSACANLGVLKDDLNQLRNYNPEDLQKIVRRCISAYEKAVDFLTTELPLTSAAYLPYKSQLTFIVEFFNLCPTPSIQQRSELKKWFWRTSLSGYFRNSNYSFVRGVLNQIRAFAQSKIDTLEISIPINYEVVASSEFSLNKASSKAFALLLAEQKPRCLLDGAPVDTMTVLSMANRHEYHHIFPKNYLQKQKIPLNTINLHANFCMLNLDNNRKISDKQPSEYFNLMYTLLGLNLEAVLASNYISIEAYQACLRDDYDSFIRIRKNTLIDAMKRLTE